MATKVIKRNEQKGAVERVVEAAADAAQELGVAATSFKQTLRHVNLTMREPRGARQPMRSSVLLRVR